MGDQCANIAKLVRLSGDVAPKDDGILDTIERMGQVARSQLSQATEGFAMRNVTVGQNLVGLDGEINTVDIAEQTVFVVTGLFREFAGEPQPA